MHALANKTPDNKSYTVTNSVTQKQSSGAALRFINNRPEAVTQRKLQEMANNSPQTQQAAQMQAIVNSYSTSRQKPIQKKENNTGLPDNLKTGIENLSGFSMDDVKVHYNSGKPAQLQAHAYAQGTDIHIASGQERHLPHEAWHVVQQKQGRVNPTIQMKGGVNINDDASLEKEADVMGSKALQLKTDKCQGKSCGCDSCAGKISNPHMYQLVIAPVSAANYHTVVQRKCRICSANSHSTKNCPKSEEESKKEQSPSFSIASRDGCFADDKCTNRLSGADFCHNCAGTHVRWTYTIRGLGDKSFCWPCTMLGKDEGKAKEKMAKGVKDYAATAVTAE